jgi:integrase
MPKKIAKELADWMETMKDQRPEAFIFASKRGTPMSHHNFLSRNLKSIVQAALKKYEEAGKEMPEGYLAGVNHRAFRTTCATWAQKEGTVKDVQAMLRHSKPTMTAGTYMQPIPESVRRAVEGLDEKLRATVHNCSQVKRRSVSAKSVND